jgi:hypothetical protein|tara:strand:+ start:3785 stop:4054 length:270 start_codon:yes stop_codon:yes gene_type:complete
LLACAWIGKLEKLTNQKWTFLLRISGRVWTLSLAHMLKKLLLSLNVLFAICRAGWVQGDVSVGAILFSEFCCSFMGSARMYCQSRPVRW